MAINFADFEKINKCQLSGIELDKTFEEVAYNAKSMETQTSDNMLIAYAYYKQATEGDKPDTLVAPITDIIKNFKYNSWQRLKGMSQEQAKRNYIDFIGYLKSQSK